ncbi:phage portal protein [candidate division WOR-3 bacterium]|nr:phage portal protein [candidate division WOR-3 bacterium]
MLNEALQKLQSGAFTKGEILKNLIDDDLKSDVKAKMAEGVNYYGNKPDILDEDFREYKVEGVTYTDQSKGNKHVTNNFQKLLVDQKAAYIVGNPVVLEVTNKKIVEEAKEKAVDDVKNILGEGFEDIINDWITGASNKAWETVHVFINLEGDLKYEIVPSEQIIPIFDTNHEKQINQIIRYYEVTVVDNEGKESTRYAAEWWTAMDVTYYLQNEHGDYELDVNYKQNPAPHYYKYNTSNKKKKQGWGWGKVPFILLYNNSKQTTDLEPIKRYIDAYDAVTSGFLNDIKDIQTAIWVLKGYEGTDLSEFMQNLIKFKAIKLEADEHAGAEPERLEIPVEARKIMLEILDNKIYSIGQGVDLNKLVDNTSGVALKILFTGLDMKANTLIRKLKKVFEDLTWFICEFIKLNSKTLYDYKDFGFVINKSTIYNVAELCANIVLMTPFMSKATAVANNPYVEDAKAELELMEKEEAADIEAYGKGIGKEKIKDGKEENEENNT